MKNIRCGLRWVRRTVDSRKVELYFFFSEENLVMHFKLSLCCLDLNVFCDHETAGKADVMGIYNILFMVEKGLIPKEMTNKVIIFCIFQKYRNYFRCSSPTLLAFSEHSGLLTHMLNL